MQLHVQCVHVFWPALCTPSLVGLVEFPYLGPSPTDRLIAVTADATLLPFQAFADTFLQVTDSKALVSESLRKSGYNEGEIR